jgi:sugar lactone lactonase YvrE
MTKASLQQLKKLALIATATAAATISVAACSTNSNDAGPTATSTSATAPTTAQAGGCEINQSSAPVPTAEKYHPVPAADRITVELTGIPSGTIKPGDPPAEVEVKLCNNSPVDYPNVGVVLVLTGCSCATAPIGLPEGTADRFDAATGQWVPLRHPVITTGADYLGSFANELALPKGKSVTLRYRVALDASMVDGKGGVEASVVLPDSLVQIGKADLPFTVSKETTPSNAPTSDVLPFTGLSYPSGVAVTAGGDVYLTDTGNDRVLKLPAGSNAQSVLAFNGLKSPGDVAVDTAGNVYVTDGNTGVVKLAAGSNEQTVLPLTGLGNVQGVAVDNAGNVYVTDFDRGDTKVVKLAAGSNEQTVLPFTGVKSANAIAVDSAGTVFVNDGPNNRVLKLAAGATDQTEVPVTGLDNPRGLAVDAAGDVYVIDRDNRQVVKLAAGSNAQTVVPTPNLSGSDAVAVDGADNLYVIDNNGFGRVVKWAAS